MSETVTAPQDLTDFPAIADTISNWLPSPAEEVDQCSG